jgi:hypothetical protein
MTSEAHASTNHKLYDKGLILLYVSDGAANVRGVEIYKDKTTVSSLPQLVSDAVSRSNQFGENIGWLRIIAHGSPKSIKIGTSEVSEHNIDLYKTDFQALARKLTPKAVIELYSCRTGLAGALLLKISDILGGRAVLAYKEKQYGSNLDRFQWTGDAQVCMSQICYTLDNEGKPRL